MVEQKIKMILLLLICQIAITSAQAQESAFIEHKEGRLHYRTFGKGTPVVIINGGPGMNSEGFAALAGEIAEMGYMAILFDQRGTGQSTLHTTDSSTITMDKMAADMELLREHLGLQQWILLGHSFGGLLAAHYAHLFPKHIKKIIFSSSGGINLGFQKYVWERLMANLSAAEKDSLAQFEREGAQYADWPKELLRRRADVIARAYVYKKDFAPQIADRLMQANYAVNALVYKDLHKIKFDHSKHFGQWMAPVLIFQGKNDIISVETAEEIRQAFPKAQLITADQCGHYGWLDQRDLYLNAIKAFIKK